MKFYRDINWNKIINNKLTAIYLDYNIYFYKDGKIHNSKNVAYIRYDNRYKEFYLNGKLYGNQDTFTKESWRRFVKLQVFL
jgi:hypothetical protein